jgi:hypothetical protein
LILCGGFYRRLKSVGGFGITLELSGTDVPDNVKQQVAQKIEEQGGDLSPSEAARAYDLVLERVRAQFAPAKIRVVTPTSQREPAAYSRLRSLRNVIRPERLRAEPHVTDAVQREPIVIPNDIAQIVRDAINEVKAESSD